MLNYVIQMALRNRLLIVCVSLAVIVLGSVIARSLPIDVLPDLTRPRVTLLTEAMGLAPEEVEQRVTFPLETAIIGAPGVSAVRSSSDIGFSMIQVDFDWGSDIYQSRQIIQERVASVRERLPRDVELHMGPISSLLGQIVMVRTCYWSWFDPGGTPTAWTYDITLNDVGSYEVVAWAWDTSNNSAPYDSHTFTVGSE